MTDAERDEWAAEVLERIRRHRRRDVSGLWSMLDDDLADCLDVLAVLPRLLKENRELVKREDYERRRLEHLKKYRLDWKRIRRETGLEN